MPQPKFSIWIFIITLTALLTACGGSSSGPKSQQPAPPVQSTPGDNNGPGDNFESEPEPEPVTTPDSFSFAPQEGVTPGELVESNAITLTGITGPASISIINGEYKLGDGNFTAEDGRIEPAQSLTLRTMAPSKADTAKETVVTIGGVSASFIVHTMEDKEPPTASIIFPNVISASEQKELTIRGTAKDALSEIAQLTLIVNGTDDYEVETEDNFASWRGEVTLTPAAENIITVSVTDEHGNVDTKAAIVVVHQQAWQDAFPDDENVFVRATGLTYDEERHRIFVADDDTYARRLIEIDLFTGKRVEFFQGHPWEDFNSATALAIDKPQNRLLVVNARKSAVYSLRLDGELQPTLLTNSSYPGEDQHEFWSPRGIALDPVNPDRAFVTAGMYNKNITLLDLNTGLRRLLSDNETPDGENPFAEPRGLLVDNNNNRVLMGSSFSDGAVFAVDKTTGKRTILSGPETTGGGDIDFYCPETLGSDRLSERVLVGDCVYGIISVDIDTGARTLIKPTYDGKIKEYGMYLYVEEGWEVLYYVDIVHKALLMLDLETKEHVILSKGARVE